MMHSSGRAKDKKLLGHLVTDIVVKPCVATFCMIHQIATAHSYHEVKHDQTYQEHTNLYQKPLHNPLLLKADIDKLTGIKHATKKREKHQNIIGGPTQHNGSAFPSVHRGRKELSGDIGKAYDGNGKQRENNILVAGLEHSTMLCEYPAYHIKSISYGWLTEENPCCSDYQKSDNDA